MGHDGVTFPQSDAFVTTKSRVGETHDRARLWKFGLGVVYTAPMMIVRNVLALFLVATLISGCGWLEGKVDENEVPQYDPRKRPGGVGLLGSEGISIGGAKKRGTGEEGEGSGIGVNSFLWRASLDTVAFMPVASADPFGGVIITDWYSPNQTPSERFKLNVYIRDRSLRADGVKVSAFRQVLDGGTWRDAAIPEQTAGSIEDAILTKARQLRNESAANR